MSEGVQKSRASEAELDLAKAAAAQRLDPELVELAGLAEGGGGPVLALLVSGAILVGRLVDETAIDDALNAHVSTVFAQIAKNSETPEHWRAEAEKLAQQRLQVSEKRRKGKMELMERYEAEVGDADLQLAEMSADLARDLISD